MELTERHFGPIAAQFDDGSVEVDVGSLVARLLLFEQCIVESIRLREIPALVSVFGVGGLLEFIDSGALVLGTGRHG